MNTETPADRRARHVAEQQARADREAAQRSARIERATPSPAPDDPAEYADRILTRWYARGDQRTLVNYRDEMFEWPGVCYRALPAAEFVSRVWQHLEALTDLDSRAAAAFPNGRTAEGPPSFRVKVTTALVANVVGSLKARCLVTLPAGTGLPCWLPGHTGPDPRDLFAAANGLVHLPAWSAGSVGALLPSTPAYFNLSAADYSADPAALPPAGWLEFLRQVFPGDFDAVLLLQEVFGYLLVADNRLQKMFMFYGRSRSGKGTVLAVLRGLLGALAYCKLTMKELAGDFGLAQLPGKLVAAIEDADGDPDTVQKR